MFGGQVAQHKQLTTNYCWASAGWAGNVGEIAGVLVIALYPAISAIFPVQQARWHTDLYMLVAGKIICEMFDSLF